MTGRKSRSNDPVTANHGHHSRVNYSQIPKSIGQAKLRQSSENNPPTVSSYACNDQEKSKIDEKKAHQGQDSRRQPSSIIRSVRLENSLEDQKPLHRKPSSKYISRTSRRSRPISVDSLTSYDGSDGDTSSNANDGGPRAETVADEDAGISATPASPQHRRLRPSQRAAFPLSVPESPTKKRDRFIPSRLAFSTATSLLHVGLPVEELTSRERWYRRTDELADPFADLPRHRPHPHSSDSQGQARRHERLHSLRSSTVLDPQLNVSSITNRQISHGSVWRVGGSGAATLQDAHVPSTSPIPLPGATPQHVPIYRSSFLARQSSSEERNLYSKRLSIALELDRADRVLGQLERPMQTLLAHSALSQPADVLARLDSTYDSHGHCVKILWQDCQWVNTGSFHTRGQKPQDKSDIPLIPFSTVLEAPDMRDDFYSSVLAYCNFSKCMAVGLGSKVYLWTEKRGVISMPTKTAPTSDPTSYVTSLAFSPECTKRSILAIGHGDGSVVLWSPVDPMARVLEGHLPAAAVHVSFHPTAIQRPSHRNPLHVTIQELLLTGDSSGALTVIFVEWPNLEERDLSNWSGGMFVYARIALHCQQVCGISWSPGGAFFATGGNDNLCCLMETSKVLQNPRLIRPQTVRLYRNTSSVTADFVEVLESSPNNMFMASTLINHQWRLNAAVKAMAFCPWQRGLLAVGGGSNDRCIHFYHTVSGAALAIIDCAAQITALIWSHTRRELAVTLGFPTPDHPYRIVVYSWPNCEQVVAIPWYNEMRALYAIPYPGTRNVWAKIRPEAGTRSRIVEEGCIVIASSDGTVKFHEIWSESSRRTGGARGGLLAGSDILESFHGIDKDGAEVIR